MPKNDKPKLKLPKRTKRVKNPLRIKPKNEKPTAEQKSALKGKMQARHGLPQNIVDMVDSAVDRSDLIEKLKTAGRQFPKED